MSWAAIALLAVTLPLLVAGRVWRRVRGRAWWLDLGALASVYVGATATPQLAWLAADGRLTTVDVDDPWFAVVALFGSFAGGVVTVAWAAVAGFPLATTPARRGELALGVGVGLGTAALAAGWSALAAALGAPGDQLVAHAMEGEALPAWVRWLSAATSVTAGPVVEELLFRGVAFGVLVRRFGAPTALSATALAFGLLHGLQPPVLASALTYGVAWGWLRARTGSVWPGVVAHMVNNLLAVLVGS